MATQIRKFEQDAIVESILEKVTEDKTSRAFDSVKNCKEY